MRPQSLLPLLIAFSSGLPGFVAAAPAADSAPASMPQAPAFDPADPPMGVFNEQWYAVMLAGHKCGQMHTRMERRRGDGLDLIQTWTKMQLTLRRDQAEVGIGIEQKSVETLDGSPQSFVRTLYLGRQPTVTEGTIRAGRVTLTATQFGQKLPPQVYDYPTGALMEWAAYREQLRRGLKPGTRYDVMVYEPSIAPDRACKTTVEVLEPQTIDLFGRKVEAVKTRQIMEIPQIGIAAPTQESTLWITPAGEILRMTMAIMDIPIEVFACSKAVAMADNDPAELMVSTLVPLAGPIDADRARQVTFRIGLKEGAPAASLPDFPESGMQRILSRGDREVTLAVSRSSPAATRPATPLPPAERQRYLTPSAAANFKDPKVAALADEAAGTEKDPRRLADRLSRFVSGYVQSKTLNVGFATASEVARSREGDCTEHGLLLATLGRARGIPTRIVTGLVYTEEFGGRSNVLIGHLWTQFWIDGGWLDVDPALHQHTAVDPTHIALAFSSASDDGFADLIAATWLSIGKLAVTVVSTEPQ